MILSLCGNTATLETILGACVDLILQIAIIGVTFSVEYYYFTHKCIRYS